MAVNVVGKYRYRMTSPADSTWVPLIIDIILVGRTKIITLHSGIWLENAIDRRAAAHQGGGGGGGGGVEDGRQVEAHRHGFDSGSPNSKWLLTGSPLSVSCLAGWLQGHQPAPACAHHLAGAAGGRVGQGGHRRQRGRHWHWAPQARVRWVQFALCSCRHTHMRRAACIADLPLAQHWLNAESPFAPACLPACRCSPAGCYLPLTAVLGGRLFLRPEGFQEASRDVVRLTPDIDYILSQQGFMLCEPEVAGMEEVPLHVALQAIPAKVGCSGGRCCRPVLVLLLLRLLLLAAVASDE